MEKDHMEDLSVEWRIILKWSLKKFGWGKAWTELMWLRTVTRSRMGEGMD